MVMLLWVMNSSIKSGSVPTRARASAYVVQALSETEPAKNPPSELQTPMEERVVEMHFSLCLVPIQLLSKSRNSQNLCPTARMKTKRTKMTV
jgi:hypothetical protein